MNLIKRLKDMQDTPSGKDFHKKFGGPKYPEGSPGAKHAALKSRGVHEPDKVVKQTGLKGKEAQEHLDMKASRIVKKPMNPKLAAAFEALKNKQK